MEETIKNAISEEIINNNFEKKLFFFFLYFANNTPSSSEKSFRANQIEISSPSTAKVNSIPFKFILSKYHLADCKIP